MNLRVISLLACSALALSACNEDPGPVVQEFNGDSVTITVTNTSWNLDGVALSNSGIDSARDKAFVEAQRICSKSNGREAELAGERSLSGAFGQRPYFEFLYLCL